MPEPNRLTTRNGVRDNRFETTNTKADVIFAFFGYNESFAGEAGLDKFKKDLDAFIKHTLAQKYNGKSRPAAGPVLADRPRGPARTATCPTAARTTSGSSSTPRRWPRSPRRTTSPFVDLFHPTHASCTRKATKPLTINGVHLNEHGNEVVAEIIDKALFAGQPEPKRDPAALEKLRQAVLDKNFYWFNRYRTVDGYSIYGGRADLKLRRRPDQPRGRRSARWKSST